LAAETTQGVATITPKIVALRRVDDEDEQTLIREHRTDRVHPRAAIPAHGGDKREPDLELIDERVTRTRQFRRGGREFLPSDHARLRG